MNWRLSREKKANFTFILALALLLLGGLVGAITIQRYFDSARRVTHSYRVKIALGDIDSTVFILSRSRLGYISSAENSFLQEFEATRDKLPVAFQQLDELTRDNPTMRQLSAELQDLENQRLGILTASVQMQQRGNSDANQQREYSRSFAIVGSSSTKVVQQMQQVEQNLLRQRIQISDRLLSVAITALSFIFLLAISLLTLHYRFLRIEARERQRAEAEARQSADASRRLSARLLTLQDEERRKFSRELHDSLGQSLTAAKMICDTAAQKNPSDTQMAQIGQILDGALTETRTLPVGIRSACARPSSALAASAIFSYCCA